MRNHIQLHHVIEHITTRSYFIWHYSVEKVSLIYFWLGVWPCNVTIQQLNSNFTPHFGILTFYSIKKNTPNHIFLLTLSMLIHMCTAKHSWIL
jgi:hypothetical protein